MIFPKNCEICLMSFSLHAAFKIILNPLVVLVIIKSSIIPPSLFSKKEYFEQLIFKDFKSAGIIFSKASVNVYRLLKKTVPYERHQKSLHMFL